MDRDAILIVLVIAVVVNVVVIGLTFLSLRGRRAAGRAGRAPVSQAAGILAAAPAPLHVPPASGGSPSDQAGRGPSSTAFPGPEVAPMTDRAAPEIALPSSRWALPPHEDPRAEATIQALVHGPVAPEPETDAGLDALVDPATGLGARLAWDEAFRNEERRLARYHRATTVLVAELDGLDALAERLGQAAADRLIPPVGDALRRNARGADIVTRVGHARFHALLPETDEIGAINYVDRVRTACDMWLEAGAVAVRLAIGWASPGAGATLADALRVAEERMNADRRSGAASRPVADQRPGRPTNGASGAPEGPAGPTGSPGGPLS